MATTNRTKNDWIALLEAANAGPKSDPIPKDFRPMDDWLKEFDIGETTWRRQIPILEENGVMVRGYFRTIVPPGNRTLKKPFWKKAK